MATVTTTLFTQISRGPGLITSPSFTMAVLTVPPVIGITLILNLADLQDPSLTIQAALQNFNIATSQWQNTISFLWSGDPATVVAPSGSYSCSRFSGIAMRAMLNLSRIVSVGLSGFVTS